MVELPDTFSIKEAGLSPGVSDEGRRGVAAAWAPGGSMGGSRSRDSSCALQDGS